MSKKLAKTLKATAEAAGARDLVVVASGKHPKLYGRIGDALTPDNSSI